MSLDLHDTITASSSPPGPAERGIVRISGNHVTDVLTQIFTADEDTQTWKTVRRPTRFEGQLNLPTLGVRLSAALMFWPTSRSYTGQPMAELHTIGSPPLLDAVVERLLECGARHAGRGEFTMRAFLAGRIDLVQAEAVLGVIDAADHEELEAALTQLGGGITETLASVRNDVLSLLGDLEAGLDFVEEDIEFISHRQICDRLAACHKRLDQLADDSAERLPSGYRRRVVLAGLPNAGKSTLFNRLLGAQRAIVSPIAGTTRDYLSGVVEIGGLEVEVIDTAGWEVAADLIMQRAQQLRSAQLRCSDVVVWCEAVDLPSVERETDRRLRAQLMNHQVPVLEIVTRCDLQQPPLRADDERCRVSAETGAGLTQLDAEIAAALNQSRSSRAELVSSTAARCRDSLRRSMSAMVAAQQAAEAGLGDEVIALELRDTLHQIATILGEVYTDDILDHIFTNFCIGK